MPFKVTLHLLLLLPFTFPFYPTPLPSTFHFHLHLFRFLFSTLSLSLSPVLELALLPFHRSSPFALHLSISPSPFHLCFFCLRPEDLPFSSSFHLFPSLPFTFHLSSRPFTLTCRLLLAHHLCPSASAFCLSAFPPPTFFTIFLYLQPFHLALHLYLYQ